MPLMSWATHVLQWPKTEGSEVARRSKTQNSVPVQIVGSVSYTHLDVYKRQAVKVGLGPTRINMVTQSAFFKLSEVIPNGILQFT